MKPKLTIVAQTGPSIPRYLKLIRKPVQLLVVKSEKNVATGVGQSEPKLCLSARIHSAFQTILCRIDQFATQARDTDERVRKMRAEHYAKHGFFFRDRF